ncbi:unnamed protein product [Gemmataceae bacterium]|nr:unnamed protein product [Gemmataceae bacterium]VTT96562.1 unnamed protein product [Gemmataceae bacterium]
MAAKLFRCTSCEDPVTRRPGVEFEAAGPTCPACGDAAVELETIHFDPPSGRPGKGLNRAACDPALRIGRPRLVMSGLVAAVTCRACKATEVWKHNAGVQGVPVVTTEPGG